MKEVDFNVNEFVKVKLTEEGKRILKDKHDNLRSKFPTLGEFKLSLDQDGYYNVQLWCLMQEFRDCIYMGCELPFETDIKINIKE